MPRYEINKVDAAASEITVHRIPYHYDERSGLWGVWNISEYLRTASMVVDEAGIFMDWKHLKSENKSPVLIKQVLKINPEVYKLNFLSESRLRVIKELCQPGSSSICTVSNIVDAASNNILVENFAKMVLIDKSSRKLVKLPEWFLQKYTDAKCLAAPIDLQKSENIKHPDECFEYQTRVRFSDIDSNNHMSFGVYIKHCFDCATTFSFKGELVHFKGDITMYPVMNISMEFFGECFVGEEILVKMWQDEIEVSKFRFKIFKINPLKQAAFIVCLIGLDKMNL